MKTSPTAGALGRGLRVESGDVVVGSAMGFAQALASYHRHRVHDLSNLGDLLEQGRPVVIVGNHTLNLVDPLLFVSRLYRDYGAIPRFVGHENLLFRIPGLRELCQRYEVVPSRDRAAAEAALRRDGVLMIYPGSGTEAVMRLYRQEPYRLKWAGRFGFLDLALACDAEIVFVAAVGVEEMYYQSRVAIPPTLLRIVKGKRYRGAYLSFGLLGPHLLPALFPLPVQITHVVSPPLDLGDRREARLHDGARAALHQRLWDECQDFLSQAIAAQQGSGDLPDRWVRRGEAMLQRLGV